MAQLRHSKLYKTAKKEAMRGRAVNRNPMKVGGVGAVPRLYRGCTAAWVLRWWVLVAGCWGC